MRLTPCDLVVLSTLLYDGPLHGYEVAQRLAQSDAADWAPVSRPQIYYSLKKLAAGGYLEAVSDTEPARGPDRVVYKPSGEALPALRAALARDDWVRRDPPAPFVTWAALALHGDDATVKRQLARRADHLDSDIAREEATLTALESAPGRDAALARVLVRMAIARMRADRDHLDDLRRVLTGDTD